MSVPAVATSRSAPGTPAPRRAAVKRIAAAVQSGVDVALQPIVDLDSGEVIGVEALARFADGRPPDEWFSEAASVGLGIALELAAVEGALIRLGDLPSTACLSVNVSAATACAPALFDMFAGVPAGRVVLEITEHVPVEDYLLLVSALERLRARGVRVAVDDAGAGFASMRHVLRLRPDVVKLDASLVRGIDSEPSHRALISALVSFAEATGCSLVAEGIETASELEAARALRVGCAQGFLLGRPAATGPARWQVDLPHKSRGRAPAVRPFGRVAKPAALLLAAALSWPAIFALAGFDRSPAGSPAEPANAVDRNAAVPAPIAASATSAHGSSKPAAAREVKAPPPTVRPSPSEAAPLPSESPPPVQRLTEEVGVLVDNATGTVGELLEGLLGSNAPAPPGERPNGLLGGLLGG